MAKLGDSLLRVLEARMRFHRQMGEMTMSFIREAIDLGADTMREAAGQKPEAGRPERARRFQWTRDAEAPETPQPAETTSRLLLEGAPGEVVLAAFGVENNLGKPCVAKFELKPGSEVSAFEQQIDFEPSVTTLQAGEQAVIQVSAKITEQMAPGVSYLGEIEVVGLPASAIPIVVRRRADPASEGSPAD